MDTVERKITKIGHSYGVVIPNDLLKIAGLKQADEVLLDSVEPPSPQATNNNALAPNNSRFLCNFILSFLLNVRYTS